MANTADTYMQDKWMIKHQTNNNKNMATGSIGSICTIGKDTHGSLCVKEIESVCSGWENRRGWWISLSIIRLESGMKWDFERNIYWIYWHNAVLILLFLNRSLTFDGWWTSSYATVRMCWRKTMSFRWKKIVLQCRHFFIRFNWVWFIWSTLGWQIEQ